MMSTATTVSARLLAAAAPGELVSLSTAAAAITDSRVTAEKYSIDLLMSEKFTPISSNSVTVSAIASSRLIQVLPGLSHTEVSCEMVLPVVFT